MPKHKCKFKTINKLKLQVNILWFGQLFTVEHSLSYHLLLSFWFSREKKLGQLCFTIPQPLQKKGSIKSPRTATEIRYTHFPSNFSMEDILAGDIFWLKEMTRAPPLISTFYKIQNKFDIWVSTRGVDYHFMPHTSSPILLVDNVTAMLSTDTIKNWGLTWPVGKFSIERKCQAIYWRILFTMFNLD